MSWGLLFSLINKILSAADSVDENVVTRRTVHYTNFSSDPPLKQRFRNVSILKIAILRRRSPYHLSYMSSVNPSMRITATDKSTGLFNATNTLLQNVPLLLTSQIPLSLQILLTRIVGDINDNN